MPFDDAFKKVLKSEGGYVNHPADRGGPTNYGITQATYNHYRTKTGLPPRDVRNISNAEVRLIYRDMYWVAAHCGLLPERLALVHFDSAVNHGVAQAIRFLQTIVGSKPDGVFGPITKRAVERAVELMPEDTILLQYLRNREDFYHRLVLSDPSQGAFLKGWLNRIDGLCRDAQLV